MRMFDYGGPMVSAERRPDGVAERTVEVNGCAIRLLSAGVGAPAFVLLHGWGASSDVMMPILLHLARRYRVIALDFPGFGNSPPPPQAWGVPEYADLVSACLASLDLHNPVLLCHSFGARVAIYLTGALGYPADRLILTGAAGLRAQPAPGSGLRRRIISAGKRVVQLLPASMGDRITKAARYRLGSADYRAAEGVMREALIKTVELDLQPWLPHIAQDTLLIWGSEDTETPLSQGEVMARDIPRAGLAVIQGAGHYCFLERPGTFFSILDSYCNSAFSASDQAGKHIGADPDQLLRTPRGGTHPF